jgi:hypothetical protein
MVVHGGVQEIADEAAPPVVAGGGDEDLSASPLPNLRHCRPGDADVGLDPAPLPDPQEQRLGLPASDGNPVLERLAS